MTATFVVVPQWQGSPSSRAMRQADGAAAIRGDLPSAATREVAVPLEAGDEQSTGVARFSSLQLVRERMRDVLDEVTDTPIVVGGDCGVSAAAVMHAAEKHGDLAVIWFDAHPDLNDVESSPSGAYAGMVLRSIVDDGIVPAGRVLLVGARSWDPGEEAFAVEAGIRSFSVDELADATALVAAVAETGAQSVYLHIDLDVLDPGEIAGLLDPEPFGLAASSLVAAVKALRGPFVLAGATIAAYAPASPAETVDDAPTILRIIGALAS
ncbi:arginase family protein [Lysinimonas soli]|uniref:Arginase family protein n=1 Tax=Lysinimonas soli TaxID=1074233 RepID=A0ABW0NLI1_9MICO